MASSATSESASGGRQLSKHMPWMIQKPIDPVQEKLDGLGLFNFLWILRNALQSVADELGQELRRGFAKLTILLRFQPCRIIKGLPTFLSIKVTA